MKFWVLCWIRFDGQFSPCRESGLVCLDPNDADVFFSLKDAKQRIKKRIINDDCWRLVELET